MGQFRDLWLRWKMLRLPWRKRFLIGQDLRGNTFWEFKDQLNHNRFRRIVKFKRKTYFSEVDISPQWHQWLRQTRLDPPTLQEQAADLQRQAILKQNAQLADERWAAKAKYIEDSKPVAAPSLRGDPETDQPKTEPQSGRNREAQPSKGKPAYNSQEQGRGQHAKDTGINPGNNFQPEAWTPAPAKR